MEALRQIFVYYKRFQTGLSVRGQYHTDRAHGSWIPRILHYSHLSDTLENCLLNHTCSQEDTSTILSSKLRNSFHVRHGLILFMSNRKLVSAPLVTWQGTTRTARSRSLVEKIMR